MSDYENMIISAVRYAIGRTSYIVNLTVEYVLKDIEQGKLANNCLWVMRRDIKEAKYLGMDCDKRDWQRLLKKINENMGND